MKGYFRGVTFLVVIQLGLTMGCGGDTSLSSEGGGNNDDDTTTITSGAASMAAAVVSDAISQAFSNNLESADVRAVRLAPLAVVKAGTISVCETNTDCDVFTSSSGVTGSCPTPGSSCIMKTGSGSSWPACTTDADCDVFKASSGYTGSCDTTMKTCSITSGSTDSPGSDANPLGCGEGMSGNRDCSGGGSANVTFDCSMIMGGSTTATQTLTGEVTFTDCQETSDEGVEVTLNGSVDLSGSALFTYSASSSSSATINVDRSLNLQGDFDAVGTFEDSTFDFTLSLETTFECNKTMEIDSIEVVNSEEIFDCSLSPTSGTVTVDDGSGHAMICEATEGERTLDCK